MKGAYYNEYDKHAAAWLRELIKAEAIAPGEVDERSIEDVCAEDLRGFVQHHWFAGIGVWSAALRGAGWSDDRPVWTGSCPCQPFSAAGKGAGFDDERHLWPSWFWLIEQLRPELVLGEQVASKDGLSWFDLVSTDLEGAGYAVGQSDLCAAGVGAPHIRQRLFFVAHHHHQQQRDWGGRAGTRGRSESSDRFGHGDVVDAAGEQVGFSGRSRLAGGASEELADAVPAGRPEGWTGSGVGSTSSSSSTGDSAVGHHHQGSQGRRLGRDSSYKLPAGPTGVAGAGTSGRLGDSDGERETSSGGLSEGPDAQREGGVWASPDWLPCRDGKQRPVESGTFPLVDGAPGRVGRLRGYGNAIVLPVAQTFIESVMDVL